MNYELARHNMIEQQIRPWHVLNPDVLQILGAIRREDFTPQAYRHLAYADFAIPLDAEQFMLCPKVVGRALTTLQITPEDKVLEIGTGTGYVTACLAEQAHSVLSIEIIPALLAQASDNLKNAQSNKITLEEGDAALGWEAKAPYDVIVVTGSYPNGLPPELTAQLKPGGRLFAIQGEAPIMEAVLVKRLTPGQIDTKALFETSVPPLIHAPQPGVFQF